MRWRAISGVVAAALGASAPLGCNDEVQVAVELGECDLAVVDKVGSVDAVLKRDDGFNFRPPCASTIEPVRTMDDLGALLAASFSFRDVPTGGEWTLAVRGFSDARCQEALFCGRSGGLTLPPASGRIEIRINCPPIYREEVDYKDCIRE
jgi:hypothetical protein